LIDSLKALLDRCLRTATDETEARDHELEVATAALLLATVRADFEEGPEELRAALEVLGRELELDDEESRELAELAGREVDRSVSLYDFTHVINDRFDEERKAQLVETMWRVALADGVLEKHEEFLIRKVAGLIYVPHRDFIAAKLRVQAART
jgi:uncharacterized tellurite resistance protein B-like protein